MMPGNGHLKIYGYVDMIKAPPPIIMGQEPEADLPVPTPSQELWKVFLVDDDEDDTRLALRILKQSPRIAKIICVANGTSLFEQLNDHNFYQDGPVKERGVILLDIHMPGLDGISLLEQLRSNPFTSAIPVIMVTGDRAERKLHTSYMLNANAYISKPFSEDHLDNIHAVFDKGQGWDQSSH